MKTLCLLVLFGLNLYAGFGRNCNPLFIVDNIPREIKKILDDVLRAEKPSDQVRFSLKKYDKLYDLYVETHDNNLKRNLEMAMAKMGQVKSHNFRKVREDYTLGGESNYIEVIDEFVHVGLDADVIPLILKENLRTAIDKNPSFSDYFKSFINKEMKRAQNDLSIEFENLLTLMYDLDIHQNTDLLKHLKSIETIHMSRKLRKKVEYIIERIQLYQKLEKKEFSESLESFLILDKNEIISFLGKREKEKLAINLMASDYFQAPEKYTAIKVKSADILAILQPTLKASIQRMYQNRQSTDLNIFKYLIKSSPTQFYSLLDLLYEDRTSVTEIREFIYSQYPEFKSFETFSLEKLNQLQSWREEQLKKMGDEIILFLGKESSPKKQTGIKINIVDSKVIFTNRIFNHEKFKNIIFQTFDNLDSSITKPIEAAFQNMDNTAIEQKLIQSLQKGISRKTQDLIENLLIRILATTRDKGEYPSDKLLKELEEILRTSD